MALYYGVDGPLALLPNIWATVLRILAVMADVGDNVGRGGTVGLQVGRDMGKFEVGEGASGDVCGLLFGLHVGTNVSHCARYIVGMFVGIYTTAAVGRDDVIIRRWHNKVYILGGGL